MSDQKLKLHLATSQKSLPENRIIPIYMMLQIIQPQVNLEQGRLPLNVCFVLDRSGSMAGQKLDFTKKAVNFAINHLEAADTVSVVTFDGAVDLLIPANRVANKDQLIARVSHLQPGGTTNLSGGLIEGADQVKMNRSEERVNRVLLLTDGLANQGITEPGRLVEMAKDIRSSGISLSTLGVGEVFDEDLLVDLAEAGDGNFYFIASPDAIPPIFEQELQGLLSVTGQNPTLHIKPAAGVKLNRVFGYEPQQTDHGVLFKLPDIYNGETKTVIAELYVETASAAMKPVADLNFRYFDVTAEFTKVNYDLSLMLEVTADQTKIKGGFDLRVSKEVELFKAGQAREDALKRADRRDYDRARKILLDQSNKLRAVHAINGDYELLIHAKNLESEALQMEETLYSPNSRKSAKQASYNLRKKR